MGIFAFLFSPKGRVRRRDYWIYVICIYFLSNALMFGGHQILTHHPASAYFADLAVAQFTLSNPLGLYMWGLTLVFLWPGLCVSIKRWHDRNRPAWLAVTVQAVLLGWSLLQINFGPTAEHPNMPLYYVSLLLACGLGIWVFVECGCLDGTKGPNRYGASPKGISGPSDVF